MATNSLRGDGKGEESKEVAETAMGREEYSRALQVHTTGARGMYVSSVCISAHTSTRTMNCDCAAAANRYSGYRDTASDAPSAGWNLWKLLGAGTQCGKALGHFDSASSHVLACQ